MSKPTKATVKAALNRGAQMWIICDNGDMQEHNPCRNGSPVDDTAHAATLLSTSKGFVTPDVVSTGGIELSGAYCDRIYLVGTEDQARARMAERASWCVRRA